MLCNWEHGLVCLKVIVDTTDDQQVGQDASNVEEEEVRKVFSPIGKKNTLSQANLPSQEFFVSKQIVEMISIRV